MRAVSVMTQESNLLFGAHNKNPFTGTAFITSESAKMDRRFGVGSLSNFLRRRQIGNSTLSCHLANGRSRSDAAFRELANDDRHGLDQDS